MARPLKIVVGGYIVAFPLGGMTWHHLNYLLGLANLGHEVTFLEDSGAYSIPYNPTNWTTNPDPTYGIAYLEQTFRTYGLPVRYCYYSQSLDNHYGMSCEQLNATLAQADLLLCVSGVTPWREGRPQPRRTAVVDTDPVFTQLRMNHDPAFLDYYQQFDRRFTFGTLIGTPACPLPTHGIDWLPTRQPIALRHWPVSRIPADAFTTIGKWEHSSERHVEFAGCKYLSSKGPQWEKMLDLPARVPWKMTLGMQAMPAEDRERFQARGWHWIDPEPASTTPQSYQAFLQGSAGEFTVAKEIYTGVPSGWFSDRSAAYLASGRPVVTQPTGFESWLPTGEGCFAAADIEDAAHALTAIALDYPRHALAARNLAERHFDARIVLTDLIDRSL